MSFKILTPTELMSLTCVKDLYDTRINAFIEEFCTEFSKQAPSQVTPTKVGDIKIVLGSLASTSLVKTYSKDLVKAELASFVKEFGWKVDHLFITEIFRTYVKTLTAILSPIEK